MAKTSANVDRARILDDPANFLHSIDVDGGRALFFRTDPQLLREASFVDGRIAIATTETVPASLSEMVATAQPAASADRFLFNCSFCGSTLLSRLLDVPGRSLVLKEPRCLTDIAAWKIFSIRDGRPTDCLRPLLKLARAALRRSFTPGEAVTVKVASQGNVLVETLAEDAARVRPVFITISRTSFLRAIFRGGVERMHHAASTAWHMASDLPDGDALLREAVAAGADPLRKAANLAILARYLQVGSFQRAARAGGWNDNHVIDYDLIAQSPFEATVQAARALDLDIDDDDIERNVARLAGRYSKQPNEPFSNDRQRLADSRVHAEHRQVFEDALAWAEATLGPQRAVVG
jgi:hypothetical protein